MQQKRMPSLPSQHFLCKLSTLCTFVYILIDFQVITQCRQTCHLYALLPALCTFICTCLHCLHFYASLYASMVRWVQNGRKHCYGRAKIHLRELERILAPYEKSLPLCRFVSLFVNEWRGVQAVCLNVGGGIGTRCVQMPVQTECRCVYTAEVLDYQ